MNKEKVVTFILTLLGIGMFFLWTDSKYNEANAITYCTVEDVFKGMSKNKIHYFFTANGKLYSSYRQGVEGDSVEKGEKYLLIYDSLNPMNNRIVFTVKYESEVQLDSIHRCCKPQDLISSWDY